MYCPDLSPYHYTCPTGLPGTHSIGWLDRSAAFPTGKVEEQVLEDLRQVAATPVHLMRGTHACPFCSSKPMADGNGELWLRRPGGPIYVAPTLLIHYIESHHYRPPEEFLALIAAEVEAVPEVELRRLIEDHGHKLATNPTREDILIPLYEIQVLWPEHDFVDLIEFRKFLDWSQGPGPWLHTNRLSKLSDGYCLWLECRDPAESMGELTRRFRRSGKLPYAARYRLVYLREPWTTVAS